MTARAGELSAATSPWQQAGPQERSRRRRLLLGVVIAFIVVSALTGFPTGREVITVWLLLLLLATCAGDARLWRQVIVRDWLPLLLVLFAYDLLRGLANEVGGALFDLPTWTSSALTHTTSRAHLTGPLDADKSLFDGVVPTTWLQEHFFTSGHPHWYDAVATTVYLSHFLVSLLLAVVLWCRSYPLFRRYLAVLVALTLSALVTYVLYPAVPPWMAALNHHLPTVHRVTEETLSSLGGGTLSSLVEQGAAYANPVAAMPSLHAAVPMMLLLFFWPEVRRGTRVVLGLYTVSMALTLVYTGEHYVIDVLVGWTYAVVVVAAAGVVRRRRST